MRRLLLLDVLADDFEGSAAAAAGKVGGRPQCATCNCQFLRQARSLPALQEEGQSDSFRYPDPKQIKLDQANSRIFLPKLGWLRYRNSREVLGAVRNVTVSLSAGKWCVSIQTQREVEQPVPQATTAIGIDVGIVRFATMSDGSHLAPLARACGLEENADVVGAINILARGHRVAASGETVQSGCSMKQEPTEATTRESSCSTVGIPCL